jgi:peptidoglycan/LPS O-acetylase OafA/YrhL
MTSHSFAKAPIIPSLNGIRAISVLLVVTGHSGFGEVVPGGLGVTVFFFLSGYLITTLFIVEAGRTGKINIRTFYLRRALRLFPALVITILVSCALVLLGRLPGAITENGLLAELLYFANYYKLFFDPTDSTVPAGTNVFWSLAVEEHFYILYPFALLLLFWFVTRRAHSIAVLSVICAVVLAWRMYLITHGHDHFRTYYGTDTRIDSILFGCILALASSASSPSLPRAGDGMSARQWLMLLSATGAMALTVSYRDEFFRETERYTVQGLALIPLFYFAIAFHDRIAFRWLNHRWMDKLGVYSYFVYLIHLIVIYALMNTKAHIFANRWALLAVGLSLSIAYAMALDRFVDPYFRSLRQRLHGSGAESNEPQLSPGQIVDPQDHT